MKKIITIMLAFMFIAMSAFNVDARRHHRRHGKGAGIGLAILGSLVVFDILQKRCYTPYHSYGHWERICYPPIYKRVWNPGHYNSYGRWIRPGWKQIEISGGHCERVWVGR